MLADYSATIRRLSQGLLCDYPATIVPLVLLSGTGSRRFSDTGDSGRRGSGSCCKTPRERPAARPVWRVLGVSIPGDLRRALNTLYLRRKCPVFAFYGLRYIRILPGCKNAVHVRKWGYFEGVQKFPGNYSGQNAEKAPGMVSPPGGAPEQTGKRKTPEQPRGIYSLVILRRSEQDQNGKKQDI